MTGQREGRDRWLDFFPFAERISDGFRKDEQVSLPTLSSMAFFVVFRRCKTCLECGFLEKHVLQLNAYPRGLY